MKNLKIVCAFTVMASVLMLPLSGDAMARGGVYFGGAVVGAPAYYAYPPYYPPYPYYAYHPPGYAYGYGPPPVMVPAPYPAYPAPVVAPVAPVVGGIGIRIR